jgi:cytidylate kinase
MTLTTAADYVPGTYARKRPESSQLASRYVREWEGRRQKLLKTHGAPTEIPPCICFSRKIGVGALEVADLLARKTHLRVADREILEHMSRDSSLGRETIAFFDEMYPGRAVEMSALLFAEKSFVMGDYLRSLVNAVYALATTASTIFVGRGAHLLLPRERILAVRLICSDPFRIKRLSQLLNVDSREAARTLAKIDKEQRAFFKKAYGRKDAPASEFDLVINCDHFSDPRWCADIVARAFRKKFPEAAID